MIHYGQCLTFGFEASQHLLRIHPGFDQLDGDFAFNGFFLFGDPHRSHPTFADVFQQLVTTSHDGSRFGFVLRNHSSIQFRNRLEFGGLHSVEIRKEPLQLGREFGVLLHKRIAIRLFSSLHRLKVLRHQVIELRVVTVRLCWLHDSNSGRVL